MNAHEIVLMGLKFPLVWLAQIPLQTDIDTAEDAALVFSGPQFFTALIAGVVLAFAIQLLLTNFGVAVAISLAGGKSSDDHSDRDRSSLGGTLRKIGLAVGLGTLISVTIALFIACLFAVKLSLFVSPVSGAIVGLVIWATYFTLLVWVSSTTVGSLIGSVVNTATSGFQALVGTATAALGAKAVNQQVVATAEAAASAIRREIGSAIDPMSLRENLEDYIDTIRPPQLDLKAIRGDFESLLEDADFSDLATNDRLPNLTRQDFIEAIGSRTDLPKRDIERIAAQLETIWQQKAKNVRQKNPLTAITDFLQSAAPSQLVGGLGDRIDALVEEMRLSRQSQEKPGGVAQAMSLSLNSLLGLVVGRTDLSDVDVEKVTSQLKRLKGQVGEQTDKLAAKVSNKPETNPLRDDVETYLLHTHSWQMNQEMIVREFRDVLYDPQADPEIALQQLESINRSDFIDWLQQRGVFTQQRIQEIANLLEAIRQEVIATAQLALERERKIALIADVEQYLLDVPSEDLTPEKIQLNFKPILEDSDADGESLRDRLSVLDRLLFERIFDKRRQRGREDISAEQASIIAGELEKARDQVLVKAKDLQAAIKAKGEQQWLNLNTYLQNTGKEELNPDAIKQELKLLLDDPQAGAAALRSRVSHFDRDTLVQLLSQRQDLSETQVNQILDEVERTWTQVQQVPQALVGKAQQQYESATSAIAEYLRNTGKEELNPESIQRDLQLILEDPKTGARAIRHRLAMMDRDTLVKLLSQREDLSEEQVNQVIDEVQSNLRGLVNAPRRLARRTQQQVQDFQSAIADYLRSTDREELNPEGIQRDVELLLNDPRTGAQSLQERLAHFDRDTLVALLSQREDISPEEVNRIIDNILSVRDRFMGQLQAIGQRVQSVIDRILNKIRDYLNSLDRSELNYDGIQQDLRQLFDDPQAGFESLRDRFSGVDRDTLVALLSSREDISEADAERLVSQVERTRDRFLHRAERLQQQAQMRLEQVKRETEHQLDETRKAAASASWWLFFTALISAIASAGAGALGVVD